MEEQREQQPKQSDDDQFVEDLDLENQDSEQVAGGKGKKSDPGDNTGTTPPK